MCLARKSWVKYKLYILKLVTIKSTSFLAQKFRPLAMILLQAVALNLCASDSVFYPNLKTHAFPIIFQSNVILSFENFMLGNKKGL